MVAGECGGHVVDTTQQMPAFLWHSHACWFPAFHVGSAPNMESLQQHSCYH